jgi:hypothetical protein
MGRIGAAFGTATSRVADCAHGFDFGAVTFVGEGGQSHLLTLPATLAVQAVCGQYKQPAELVAYFQSTLRAHVRRSTSGYGVCARWNS